MKYRQRGRCEEPVGPLDPCDKTLCNETQQQFIVSLRRSPQCCDCDIIFKTGVDGNAIWFSVLDRPVRIDLGEDLAHVSIHSQLWNSPNSRWPQRIWIHLDENRMTCSEILTRMIWAWEIVRVTTFCNQFCQSQLDQPDAIEKPSANYEIAHDCVPRDLSPCSHRSHHLSGAMNYFKIVAQANIQSYVVDVDVSNLADLGSTWYSGPMT
jgi:hypothetical protein